ncbi:MAG: mechanosensitive ion channel protein MscS [Bacteroidetes bacterium HGW-Bacteroidetes-2]|jgi:small-conductance mechanosensitive channel|nr:MAG: mechanosensitive ion channel protein MscS [Bacteroidetes bacterium HGW-Bacteroidetes-2]
MQENLEAVTNVITQDIWGSIKHFFNIEILSVGADDSKIVVTVGLLLLVVVSFYVASLVLKLIRIIVSRKLPSEDQLKFLSIFNFIKYILYILIFIGILSSAGVNITLLLTASAALFVGLGLALKEIFQDIIGGLYIILDKSLLVGDIIEINGKVGRVFEIKLRTTRALTRDDKVIIIPNHNFITETIFNYTQNHRATREFVKVSVAYGTDVQKVKEILENCAKAQKEVLKKPSPIVFFEDFGDSGLVFSLNFFISDSFIDPKIKSDLRFKIEAEFRKHGIIIPFPQRDLHIHQKT